MKNLTIKLTLRKFYSKSMSQNRNTPRKPLRLPFEKRSQRGDWGDWVYRHRVGLLTTVIIYLIGTIAFLSYRIVLNTTPQQMIAIEFEKEQEPVKELTPEEIKEQQIEKIQQEAFEKVQNKISDRNSKLNSDLKDSKKSQASEIYKEAERVNRELAAGKEAYEKGMRSLEEMGKKDKSKPKEQSKSNEEEGNQRQSVKGTVTVSYDLPGRTDVFLYLPAYQCQFGGTVVVAITVNRNGKVINAMVDKSSSSDDDCITQMAVQAAYASKFNTSQSAPEKQKGTITYQFVAQ